MANGNAEPRILLWDIETDGINADRIICIGYKWAEEKRVHLLRAEDFPREGLWDDSNMLREWARIFSTADYHVTWYGSGFDLPVVNARLIQAEEKPLPPIPHIDLWKTARYQFKTGGGNRLAKWQDFLGIPSEKTVVKPSIWIKARYGHKPSLKYIYDHCIIDVEVLEKVFARLRPWVKEEPVRGLTVATHDQNACLSCGSLSLQRRGFHISRTRKYQRWQCQACGKWQHDKHSLPGVRTGKV